jgi:hypothetical protein
LEKKIDKREDEIYFRMSERSLATVAMATDKSRQTIELEKMELSEDEQNHLKEYVEYLEITEVSFHFYFSIDGKWTTRS